MVHRVGIYAAHRRQLSAPPTILDLHERMFVLSELCRFQDGTTWHSRRGQLSCTVGPVRVWCWQLSPGRKCTVAELGLRLRLERRWGARADV